MKTIEVKIDGGETRTISVSSAFEADSENLIMHLFGKIIRDNLSKVTVDDEGKVDFVGADGVSK